MRKKYQEINSIFLAKVGSLFFTFNYASVGPLCCYLQSKSDCILATSVTFWVLFIEFDLHKVQAVNEKQINRYSRFLSSKVIYKLLSLLYDLKHGLIALRRVYASWDIFCLNFVIFYTSKYSTISICSLSLLWGLFYSCFQTFMKKFFLR